MLVVPACAVCCRPGSAVCASCRLELAPAPSLPAPRGLDSLRAVLAYDAAARALLTALKNRQRRDLVGVLADAMAAQWVPPPGATVTWAPTGADRRHTRGYDQARLLATAVARRWRVPVRDTLRRRPGPAQAGRSAADRRAHPGFLAPSSRQGPLVVVDDVATTGATLSAAARALRAAGAGEVHGLVVARAASPART